jgi:hypothetical protein
LLNFTATSWPASGGIAAGLAFALGVVAVVLTVRARRAERSPCIPAPAAPTMPTADPLFARTA